MHLTHLILLAVWAGVVLAEGVLELGASVETAREVARLHYRIDMLVEAPLLAGILVTGGCLVWRAWPLSGLLWVKVVCGLVAVLLNVYCVVHVVLRHRRSGDRAALQDHRRRVLLSGLGVPPALVAAYLGLVYFAR